MAYPVGKAKAQHKDNSTTCVVTLTELSYVVGDYIQLMLAQDNGGTDITESGTSAWTVQQPASVTGAARQTLAYIKVASVPVADPTFTGTAGEAWSIQKIVIRDAPAASPIRFATSSTFTTTPTNSPTGSATEGDLLIYSACSDGTTTYIRPLNNDLIELGKDVGDVAQVTDSTISSFAGYRVAASTATSPTVVFYSSNLAEGGNGWVVAWKNDSGGSRGEDCRTGVEEGIASTTGENMYGEMGVANKSYTLQAPSTNFPSAINGIATFTSLPSAGTGTTNANTGAEFWHGQYTYMIEGTNLASTFSGNPAWCGGSRVLTATDMTGKIFSFQWMVSGVFATYLGSEGFIVVFGDGTNWAAFQIRDKTKLFQSKEISSQIDLENAVPYASSAGTMNWAAVTRVGYFLHRLPGSGAQHSLYIKNAVLIGSAVITGGGSHRPSSFTTLTTALNSWHHTRLANLQGSAQVIGGNNVTIGDGSTPTYFKASAQAFAYPLAYDIQDQSEWNVLSNRVSLTIYASASDTIDLSASSIVTTTEQALTVHASSSTSATYSTAGASIVGPWNVTWKTGVPCASATFKGTKSIDFKGADIVNVIASEAVGTALMSASNGFSATGCELTASATAVYGIRIAAAGTFDLASTTFSGFTKDIDVTAAAGTVTINLAAGQASPTFQTAGAAVTIVSSPVFQAATLSGFIAGSLIQIYDVNYAFTVSGVSVYPAVGDVYSQNGINYTVISAGGGSIAAYGVTIAEASGTLTRVSGSGDASITFSAVADNGTQLFCGTASSGDTVISGSTCTWTDSSPAAAKRHIRARVGRVSATTAKHLVEAIAGTCGTTSGTETISYLVDQQNDTSYNSNAVDGPSIYATSGITFTDATTDLVNCNTGGGSASWATIYACFVHWCSNTTTGIADDITYIDSPDPANYILTRMKVKNTGSGALTLTGGYYRDAVTGLSVTCTDTTGGFVFPSVEHVVGYATGSALTAGQAASLAAAESSSAAANTQATTAATQSTTAAAQSTLARKLLSNKRVLDPATGIETIYDDAGIALYTRLVYENAAGTQLYRDQGADRVEKYT